MISIFLSLLFVQPTPKVLDQPVHEKVQTVCQLVEQPDLYDGKMVTVEAGVVAGLHGTVLQGEECGRGIYMVHETGNKSGKWPDLDSALARKSTGLDKRQLRVKVTGLYRARVPFGSRTIRQLNVTEVSDVVLDTRQ